MKKHILNEEKFLTDVKNHEMIIVRDDNEHRYVRFKNPETITYYWFDLITWPGHLCICGDCGTFVFRRIQDMFKFFRGATTGSDKKLAINTQYWAEKVIAEDRPVGVERYSSDGLRSAVKDYFDMYFEGAGEDTEDRKKNCWQQIERDIFSCSDEEHRAYQAVYDFEYDGFYFQDFFEYDLKEYTFGYLWCLYAIVWGIMEYDKYNQQEIKI